MSKSLVRSIKNVANGYSSVQVLVRNATSNDPSGPTTYDMEEIASLTYQSQTDFLEIMDMLDRRLNDKGKNWRHVAKSLTVLDYLVRFGSEKCVLWAKDNLYIVKTLREFIHFDEADTDQGALIRVKAKELVSLLRDDERLRHERDLAQKSQNPSGRRRRSRGNTTNTRPNDEPYDDELQKALELSKLTAEEEQRRNQPEETDADLEAALKLSMEEEEMRKQKRLQNENLLDLTDEPQGQQYYMVTGYQQQPQFTQQQFAQQQYDMFGNPIQNAMQTGYYYQQQQQYAQPSQPQFTGFNYGQFQQPQQPQQQEQLQPLKTGSNNPFALQSEAPQQKPAQPSLSELASSNQQQQQQPQFFTQPTQQLKPQNTASKFNDSTHSELNNLLAQGTGIDTFGNTGATRIPHQHTKTEQFINSSGTGYKQSYGEQKLSSNATGNPFLNTGIGYQAQSQPSSQGQSSQHPSQINPAYTGYGFGNASAGQQQQQAQYQRNGTDGPSLIDI
ncbi:epsin-1 [[Candida] anglica]|uniref:Epsin-1 n=1 Tax=[Candida] anglica TaxID=148631 RepID=A0ABP0ECJ3_9ASCO